MQHILCILAGGRSSRFGASKLRVWLGEEPILAWQARRLGAGWTPQGEAVTRWLSVAPDAADIPGAASYERAVADPAAYEGPLAAIRAILATADADDVLAIVPADMPLLEPRHLWRYRAALVADKTRAAVMGRWIAGERRVEPFPALWHAGRGRALLAAAVDAGVRGPHQLAERAEVACVDLAESDRPAWSNINRPDDLARVADLLPGVAVRATPPLPPSGAREMGEGPGEGT